MRWLISIVLVLLLAVAPTARAQEPQRFALVIGNQGYHTSVGALRNPHNDIALVAAALQKQGFSVLPPIRDGRRSQILGAVRGLVQRLNGARPGAIGFVYYSGHGAAEKDTNVNYLIPVDAREPDKDTFWDESVKLDEVLRLLDGARNAAKFVIFDACRNELQLSERTSDKGFIPVREHQGMFIGYATAPGRPASDRGATSGPYAAALAAELAQPGLDHLNLFQNVKERVIAATSGSQQPWSSDGLSRRVSLTTAVKVEPQSLPTMPPATSGPAPLSEAAVAWDRIKESRSIAVLEAYAKQFGGTVYAALVSERMTELRREADSAKAAAEQRAEQQRLAALKKKEEEDKLRQSAPAQKGAGASQGAVWYPPGTDSKLPAAFPLGARQLYESAYSLLLQQNYGAAEAKFSEFLQRFPNDELTANAQFWLGETHFIRGQWDNAAAAFLKVAQNHPRSDKAPDSLAKMAMAMERKGNRSAACRTLQELNARYPNPPAHVRTWEIAEKRRAGCADVPTSQTLSCRGLQEAECSAAAEACHWIVAVTRKDGKEVPAYCRTRPKPVRAGSR